MSWDSYITSLQNSGFVEEAAIFSEDLTIWAISKGLKDVLTQEEMSMLKQDKMSYLLGAKKFIKLRKDGEVTQMKEAVSCDGDKRNATSCFVTKYRCFILAIGTKGATGGNVAHAVGKIKDYLEQI